jgi:hypothetical protein
MKCGKIVKFKDTRLEAVQYTQSGSRGKLLISFAYEDNQAAPVIRFHKIKNIKLLQAYDFSIDESIDYKFTDLIETTRIELTP